MINETKRAFNFMNNKTEGLLKCWDSPLELLMKYSYIRINFDNSSLTDGANEVAYDGYNSNINKVNYSYRLMYYDNK